jgi:hypothetical protein
VTKSQKDSSNIPLEKAKSLRRIVNQTGNQKPLGTGKWDRGRKSDETELTQHPESAPNNPE